jgi:DNA-binding protein H-NS
MTTYLELRQKAEKLMAEAEQMRQSEIDGVINDIKEKIKAYQLTAQDLGLAGSRRKNASPKAPSAIKYRGPNGETWSGGRGRKPTWVTKALSAGKKIEDFAV